MDEGFLFIYFKSIFIYLFVLTDCKLFIFFVTITITSIDDGGESESCLFNCDCLCNYCGMYRPQDNVLCFEKCNKVYRNKVPFIFIITLSSSTSFSPSPPPSSLSLSHSLRSPSHQLSFHSLWSAYVPLSGSITSSLPPSSQVYIPMTSLTSLDPPTELDH